MSRATQKKDDIEEITNLLWYVSDAVRLVVLDTLRIGAKIPKARPSENPNVININDYI
jgi:hypothetical protein